MRVAGPTPTAARLLLPLLAAAAGATTQWNRPVKCTRHVISAAACSMAPILVNRSSVPLMTASPAQAAALEAELLDAAERGDAKSTMVAFKQLEKLAPTPENLLDDPQLSGVLGGRWALLSTIAATVGEEVSDEQGMQGVVNASGIRVDAAAKKKPVQEVDIARSRIGNEILIKPGPLSPVYLRVSGAFTRAEPPAPGRRAVVQFDKLDVFSTGGRRLVSAGWLFKLQRKFAPSLANGAESASWLDTTYLSPTVRLGRGNKGSVFVLRRVDDDGGPLRDSPL